MSKPFTLSKGMVSLIILSAFFAFGLAGKLNFFENRVSNNSARDQEFIPGELFVKILPTERPLDEFELLKIGAGTYGQILQPVVEEFGITQIFCPFKVKDEKLQLTYLFSFDKAYRLQNLIKILSAFPFVEYAEPVPLYSIDLVPNDPDYLGIPQYNLSIIEAEQAWDINTACSDVVIAIVDDAVLITHEDLAPNIWVNPGEIPGDGIDNDGNGFVDDINGWDAADNDNNPNPVGANEFSFSHGTHCAGIASAATNNNIGIASIGFNTQIMAVKTASSGNGTLPFAYAGVDYAIAANADVMSMSWGGSTFSQTYQNLFNTAHAQGITLVAAAGNDNSSSLKYPASYDHVISVGASDQNDVKAGFSNYGSTIDVMAPGVGIWSSVATNNSAYGSKNGTSMACPLVSGLAGLMLCYAPTLTPDDIEQCLEMTADDVDALNPGFAGQLGAGRINALAAMTCLEGPPIPDFTINHNDICPGLDIQFTDNSFRDPDTWDWTFEGGVPGTSNLQNPLINYPNPGVFDVTLTVTNVHGSNTLVLEDYITIALPTATISGNSSINVGDDAFVQVDFTGVQPWNFTFSNGSTTTSFSGITDNPLLIPVSPNVTTTYTLTSMNSSQCNGIVSGSGLVTVFNGCQAEQRFQTIFGGELEDTPGDIAQTPDCGFVVVGKTFSYGEGSYDGFLSKLDENGEIEWFKTYGESVPDQFNDVLVLSDGYLASGWTYYNQVASSYFYLVKTDLNGNMVWTRRYRNQFGNVSQSVVEADDGHFIVAGSSFQHFTVSTQAIMKINRNTGAIMWQRIYGNTTYLDGRALNLKKTADGGYILSGETLNDNTSGLYDLFLLKVDGNGDFEWSTHYGGTDNDRGGDLEITPDGGYITVGYSRSFGSTETDILVFKTNAQGTVEWAKTYAGPSFEYAFNIEKACDGGYFLGGRTFSFGSGLYDKYLLKIDANGNLLWQKTLGGSADEDLLALTRTGDCGFITVGATQSFGSGDNDIWIIKTDDSGQLDCYETSSSFIEQNITLSTSPTVSTFHSDINNQSYPIVTSSHMPDVVEEVCDACGRPEADFDYVTNHLSVHFLNYSGGANWFEWDFGDGDTDTLQSPVHAYPSPGNYPVTLVIGNDCDTDTLTKTIEITGLDICRHFLQPGPIRGKDARPFSRPDAVDVNLGQSIFAIFSAWTYGGVFGIVRASMEFDYSEICNDAEVLDASLSLFYPIEFYPDPTWGEAHCVNFGSNAGWISNYTSSWDEYTVTWNNKPDVNLATQLPIPGTPNLDQSDLIDFDVTSLVQEQFANGNNGFELRQQSEQTYRSQRYCASDYPNPDRRPLLKMDFDPIYAYTPEPNPVICPGESVQLNIFGYPDGGQSSGPSTATGYFWRPSEGLSCTDCPSPIASPDTTTTYQVSVLNCASCADVLEITVEVSEVLLESDFEVICGDDTAQLFATVPASNSASFTWTPPDGLSDPNIPNPVASPSGQTMYTVTAIDDNGCTTMDSVLVVLADEPIEPELDDYYFCIGSGTISLELAPNLTPISDYFYEWSPLNGLTDINNPNPTIIVDLSAQIELNFELAITNFDGCTLIDTVTVEVSSELETDEEIVLCNGETVIIFGNEESVSGIYSEDFVTAQGCDSTHTVDLTVLDAIEPNLTTVPFCFGSNEGSATVSPTGGSGSYSYLWENGETTATITGLTAGNYSITITDDESCEVVEPLTIQSSPQIDIELSSEDVSCGGGSDGSATVDPTGGSGNFSFLWNDGQTTQTATGLTAGNYDVTISDSNGCAKTTTFEISEPTPLTTSISGNDLSCHSLDDGLASVVPQGGSGSYTYLWSNGATNAAISGLEPNNYIVTVTDSQSCAITASVQVNEPGELTVNVEQLQSCDGLNSGLAEAIPSGGTFPYTYIWNDGQVESIASGLSSGVYLVTVTDNSSCSVTADINLSQPNAIEVLVASGSVSCFGDIDGTATVTHTGGAGPFTYLWDNGEIGQSASFLSGGQHEVTVADATGCEVVETFEVDSPDPIIPDNIVVTPVSCNGGNDGSAIASATGGAPPFTFEWGTNPLQTGASATGLSAGVYTLTIIDSEGCTLDPVNVSVNEPPEPLSVIFDGLDPSCFNGTDGSISAIPTGGTPSYQMEWNNGDAGASTFELGAGNYTVTITDANDCVIIESIQLGQPEPLFTSLSSEDVICFGQSNGVVQVDTTYGGTAPYQYSIDGDNYILENRFEGLPSGWVTVSTLDANGCVIETDVFVNQPFEIVVDAGRDTTIELGCTHQLEATVNTFASVTWDWTPAVSISCEDNTLNCPDPLIGPFQTTLYQVVVTDENGCTATDDVLITVEINRDVFIPNVFTPNFDGVNDEFIIFGGKEVSGVKLVRIFDRWGELVFEGSDFPANDPAFGWNGSFKGKQLNPSVFVYYVVVSFVDGVEAEYKGDVTILK